MIRNGLTRRAMLKQMSAGFGMLGLAQMLGASSLGANAGVSKQKHIPARAKRVIFLFMNGGPSHLDTFDPKPALKKHEGQKPSAELFKKASGVYMPSPFAFAKHGQSGIEVSESLPNMAKVIDDCCIIRSMKTDVPNHEPALIQMHTGVLQPTRPSLGSWCLYGLGQENQNLPGYVVLRPTPQIVVGPALWSSGFLPSEFQATSLITSDMKVEKLLANLKNPRFNPAQQREQLDLIQSLNRSHLEERPGEPELEGQIRSMETAYNMQMEASDVFDIEKEPQHVREQYGDTPFARSCLLARRLVENGVRFVTVYYVSNNNQPWDTHSEHNQNHPKLCADSDKASAALIADLKSRGLLEDTLVIWGGEFGRTPYSEQKENDSKAGRDHHHTAFSMLLAGGGVKGGTVYGATDELGMNATENPVHVHDLHATILHLLGLDHEALTYRYAGRDFRLTDVFGNVVDKIIA
ncbi:MAG: DUF1501 domain-containing protein [Verrucomicrobiales bacterium]